MIKVIRLGNHGSPPVVTTIASEVPLEWHPVELAAFGQPRLEPKLAVVLAVDIPAGSLPGEVARAVGGVFLAVDILDVAAEGSKRIAKGALLLGEQLLPLELAGEVRLRVDGELVAAAPVAGAGDPVARIERLASEIDGVDAGDVVLVGLPAGSAPATSGTVLLEGPAGATLCANLRGAA